MSKSRGFSYVKSIYHQKNLDISDTLVYVDIGFERTSSLVFNNGKFQFFKSFPVGGNNITKDISKVLKLNMDYSEELKIKLNKQEINDDFNKNNNNKINLYSEIFEKNISVDMLKQIIEARIDEIIELIGLKGKFIIKSNHLLKSKLILIGNGSKLLSKDYSLNLNELVSKLIIFNENDSFACKAGSEYHRSIESSHIKIKKKIKKYGFFEYFFNLFSK